MARTFRCALVLLLASTSAHAQDATSADERAQDAPATTSPETADGAAEADGDATRAEADGDATRAETDGDATRAEAGGAQTDAEADGAETTGETDDAEPSRQRSPKVAVVVSGDPDPALRAAARRVERALEGRLRAPFDPDLRAALRGEPGAEDDGLEAVRRERRRLGFEESRDAPILAILGRRAGASAVAVLRAGEGGPELLVLDVANGAFYEGTLPLLGQPSGERIAEFVARRARISARGARIAPAAAAPAAPAAATAPDAPAESEDEPGFFEEFWPYLVAGLLLAGMVTAIAVTSATAESDQPVLRFVPGGR